MALEEIVFEIAVVENSICVVINSFAVFGAIQELSFVVGAIFPVLLPLAIGQIAEPLSRICVILGLVD